MSMALRVEEGTAVNVKTMKAEKVWLPYFGASLVPYAMDFLAVAISSQGTGPGPRPLRLYSNGHPGQFPSVLDHQNRFSVAEL